MLDGIRVLDLSRLLPGPACTWMLQGMGAAVDRVESPSGDLTRRIPPVLGGTGAFFAALSPGKRSLAMDFRHPGAAPLIKKLLPAYDVLVEGFKPGTMESMGLDPAELLEANPGLVIARLSGFGQTGPWARRVGHDINYIATAGVLAAQGTGPEGHHLPAVQAADLSGAMTAAMGICAALTGRFRTGRGRVLDVSLTESAMAMYAPILAGLLAEGRSARPGGEPLTGGATIYGTYRCADGGWIALGAIEPKFQAVLRQAAGGLDRDSLSALFASQPRDHWTDALAGACVSAVLEPGELASHPQHSFRKSLENGLANPPLGRNGGAVPMLGEHGAEILADGGLPEEEIAAAFASGLVRRPG